MEEKTADEIAAIFSAAGDSVTLINADANYAAYVTRTSSTDTEDCLLYTSPSPRDNR